MLTHHASNGCNLQPGDLIASGTVSGATKDSTGLFDRIDRRGAEPIDLPYGRGAPILAGWRRGDLSRVLRTRGIQANRFGECRGIVTPAMA